MKAQLIVFISTAWIGVCLLLANLYVLYQAEATFETAAALKFRPRVVVYRYDVPIVIQAPQVQGSGLSGQRQDRRATPVFSRDSQVWAGH